MIEYDKLRKNYDYLNIERPKRLMGEYDYIRKRYYRKSHADLINKIYNYIFCNHEDNNQDYNVLCSWFCDLDLYLIKKIFLNVNNFNFFDFDEIVHDSNMKLTEKSYRKDVIFDDLNLKGNFIHRYCEYTFPVGKIYNGNFILIGNDDDKLYIPNPINSCEDLISQNNIKNVEHQETWSVIREYDQKNLNYFMVVGDNL